MRPFYGNNGCVLWGDVALFPHIILHFISKTHKRVYDEVSKEIE